MKVAEAYRIDSEGDAALVVRFANRIDPAVNAQAQALARSIDAMHLAGVLDVVPAYRSVTVYFDAIRSDIDRLMQALEGEAPRAASVDPSGKLVRVPVCYGGAYGPDLGEVAAHNGLKPDEVMAIHSATTYRVFMLGFVPGFAYLGPVNARMAVPRRATPRVRVPAGSVAVVGSETAIYPFETPGGWQIIGRTPLKPFDRSRQDPFLFGPGDRVEFYPIDPAEFDRAIDTSEPDRAPSRELMETGRSSVRVIRPGLLTTVQDRGRWGWQSLGVPVAGPMDPYSHRVANVLVGNEPDAATLEVTVIGPELEFTDERAIAVAGAEFAITVDGQSVPMGRVVQITAGARLRFGERRSGTRAYVAVSGGVDVPLRFGSRATHVASGTGGFGGRALRVGDRVLLGDQRPGQIHDAQSKARRSRAGAVMLKSALATDPRRVRVLPGPQLDRFVDGALETLQSAPYTIGRDSDRIGFRLEGPILHHARGAEIISEATPLATIQVPGSGLPLLLMADRQTTGGYTKIATVITADLHIAGQLGPGDRIRFDVCTMKESIGALIDRERSLMALER